MTAHEARATIRAVRPTPALEFELLHMLSARRGRCSLGKLFGRRPDAGWHQCAPTWAVVVAYHLVFYGLLAEPDDDEGTLHMTPAGWRRLGVAAPNGDHA